MDPTAAAKYGNWQAKNIGDHGGNAREIYALKSACLNKLIRDYIRSCTHEQVYLEADEDSLLVTCGIGVRLMGDNYFAFQRTMHLPKDRITRQARLKIEYSYPLLIEEISSWKPAWVG